MQGKAGQQTIKDVNLKLVFNLISRHEPISRADLKKMTGLSATTVSSLCEELLQKNLIIETGTKETSTSGRKAILLCVNPNGGYFCGIEISTCLSIDIYDLNFRSIVTKTYDIENWNALSPQIKTILKELEPSLKSHGAMLGITVGVPASIDTENSRILSSTILEYLNPEEDIIGNLKQAFPHVPVLLCNDSSLVAYAEKEFGNHVSNLISIDISEGVGSGIVIDGNIYTGASGTAGEFGHVTVDYRGPKCKCGSRGCLESMISVPAILHKIEEKLNKALALSDIEPLLAAKNQAVLSVLDETAKILSFGMNNLLNLMDPELILLSGDIQVFGDAILIPLDHYLKEKALPGKQIAVQFSSVPGNAVTLGGAKYAFDVRFQ